MHGDVESPDDAILTKEDYDRYPFTARGRGFLASLEVAMMSRRTALFVGFSFTDPNVDRVLSALYATSGRSQRTHYCIMRRPPAPGRRRGPHARMEPRPCRLAELRVNDWPAALRDRDGACR